MAISLSLSLPLSSLEIKQILAHSIGRRANSDIIWHFV